MLKTRVVNRSACVVRRKEPYLKWAASIDAEAPATMEHIRDRISVYLVPEDPAGVEEAAPLEDYYSEIFEQELDSWYRDEARWPEVRDLPTFLEWFDVTSHSIVVDLGEGRLKVEEM